MFYLQNSLVFWTEIYLSKNPNGCSSSSMLMLMLTMYHRCLWGLALEPRAGTGSTVCHLSHVTHAMKWIALSCFPDYISSSFVGLKSGCMTSLISTFHIIMFFFFSFPKAISKWNGASHNRRYLWTKANEYLFLYCGWWNWYLEMAIYMPKVNGVTKAKPEFELIIVLFCSL